MSSQEYDGTTQSLPKISSKAKLAAIEHQSALDSSDNQVVVKRYLSPSQQQLQNIYSSPSKARLNNLSSVSPQSKGQSTNLMSSP